MCKRNPAVIHQIRARTCALTSLFYLTLSTYILKSQTFTQVVQFIICISFCAFSELEVTIYSRSCLQHMLEANIAQVNGESKLSDIEMSAASLSFLVAGFDTTYNTLSVALYFLTTNPHVQEKLFQEIEGAKRSKGDVPFYDLVQSVRYLEWVLLETLRLVPIGYRHFRQCVETVEINGVLFSEGVRVEIPSYALHRDPEIWPEPEIFDPEVGSS